MQQRVFEPIGMHDTQVRQADVLARGNVAVPHGMDLEGNYEPLAHEAERVVLPVAPAGAPWSNVLDMGRYLVTELNRGVSPDGNTLGFSSDLAFLPSEGLGVSVLSNASGANAVNEAIRTRPSELVYDLEPEAP